MNLHTQPKTKEEEVKWLRTAIWDIHCRLMKNKLYREDKSATPQDDYRWLPLFTACLNEYEKYYKVTLSSSWFMIMREYWYFPEAWNSLPFVLKIDENWSSKI